MIDEKKSEQAPTQPSEAARERLGVGRLEAAAIERGTRARFTTL